MRMQIPALYLFTLLEVGRCHSEDFLYEFGTDDGDPVIYITEGKIGLFEYEKEIPIHLMETAIPLQVRYVKVLVTSLSPPKVEYDSVLKKIRIKYSWAQLPPLASKYRVQVHGFSYIT